MSKWAGETQQVIDATFQFCAAVGPSKILSPSKKGAKIHKFFTGILYIEEAEHILQDRTGAERERSEALAGLQMSLLSNWDTPR